MERYWIEGRWDGPTEVTSVYFYDDIANSRRVAGSGLRELARDLRGVTGKVELHVNSVGGEAAQAILCHALLSQKPDVVTVVDGIAASGASVLAQAGTLRLIDRSGQIMIHRCRADGARPRDRSERDQLRDEMITMDVAIAAIYADRAGGDVDYWLSKMDAASVYTAEEAVKAGLADAVVGGPHRPLMVSLHEEFAPRSVAPIGVSASATRRVIRYEPDPSRPVPELSVFGVRS